MNYPNFYIAENILDWPGQLGIVKLSEPRLFIRFNYGESYFASYEEFISEIAVIEWIDGVRPTKSEQEEILTDCWNFLALTERKEDELFEQDELDDDY